MRRSVAGVDRGQGTLFPERLEDWIGEANAVRVIDVFVEETPFWPRSGRGNRQSRCRCSTEAGHPEAMNCAASRRAREAPRCRRPRTGRYTTGEGGPKGAKGAATGVEAADRVQRIEDRANPTNPSGPTKVSAQILASP